MIDFHLLFYKSLDVGIETGFYIGDASMMHPQTRYNGLFTTGCPGLQLLKEVVALVVNENKGGEVFHAYLPYGLHSELRVFHTFDALDA